MLTHAVMQWSDTDALTTSLTGPLPPPKKNQEEIGFQPALDAQSSHGPM
jgi:hypothetical protein